MYNNLYVSCNEQGATVVASAFTQILARSQQVHLSTLLQTLSQPEIPLSGKAASLGTTLTGSQALLYRRKRTLRTNPAATTAIVQLFHQRTLSWQATPPYFYIHSGLFRQLYERESNKTKRPSEHSLGERTQHRLVVNSSFNVHSGSYLTPAQLLRTAHNLSDFELSEVEEGYEEIYYWGQNCSKKIFGTERRSKEGE